jgi:hypothetical protein
MTGRQQPRALGAHRLKTPQQTTPNHVFVYWAPRRQAAEGAPADDLPASSCRCTCVHGTIARSLRALLLPLCGSESLVETCQPYCHWPSFEIHVGPHALCWQRILPSMQPCGCITRQVSCRILACGLVSRLAVYCRAGSYCRARVSRERLFCALALAAGRRRNLAVLPPLSTPLDVVSFVACPGVCATN